MTAQQFIELEEMANRAKVWRKLSNSDLIRLLGEFGVNGSYLQQCSKEELISQLEYHTIYG